MERSTKILLLAVAASLAVPAGAVMLMAASSADPYDILFQALLLFTMVPLIAMGAYMWATGRGAMLIAGYNTSPRAVRERYDAPAMARCVGKLMVIALLVMLGAMESIFLLEDMVLFGVLIVASLGILVAGIYYMNTGGRFVREDAAPLEPAVVAKDRKRTVVIALVALAATAAILIAVFALIGPGEVNASLEEDRLAVTAPFVDREVLLDDVSSAELREGFDAGRRVGGYEGSEVHSGAFRNDELGRYELAAYKAVEAHIVVHHSGGVLVFNLGTEEGTRAMFDALQQRL